MVKHPLLSFLHLIKPSGVIKLGSDFLTAKNLAKTYLVLINEGISDLSRKHVETFVTNNAIEHYDVPANIVKSLYPGKNVKVLVITSKQSAIKIANLMKEGDPYE